MTLPLVFGQVSQLDLLDAIKSALGFQIENVVLQCAVGLVALGLHLALRTAALLDELLAETVPARKLQTLGVAALCCLLGQGHIAAQLAHHPIVHRPIECMHVQMFDVQIQLQKRVLVVHFVN